MATKSLKFEYTPELFGALVMVAIWMAAAFGWIMNLIAVVHMALASGPVTTMFIGRIGGVFIAPLGAVLGYF